MQAPAPTIPPPPAKNHEPIAFPFLAASDAVAEEIAEHIGGKIRVWVTSKAGRQMAVTTNPCGPECRVMCRYYIFPLSVEGRRVSGNLMVAYLDDGPNQKQGCRP